MSHMFPGRPPPSVPSCQLSPPFVPSPRKVARGWLTSPPLLSRFSLAPCLISIFYSISPPFLHPSSRAGLPWAFCPPVFLEPPPFFQLPSNLLLPSQSQLPANLQWPSVPAHRRGNRTQACPLPSFRGSLQKEREENGKGRREGEARPSRG